MTFQYAVKDRWTRNHEDTDIHKEQLQMFDLKHQTRPKDSRLFIFDGSTWQQRDFFSEMTKIIGCVELKLEVVTSAKMLMLNTGFRKSNERDRGVIGAQDQGTARGLLKSSKATLRTKCAQLSLNLHGNRNTQHTRSIALAQVT